jgi:putative transposase
VPDQGDLPDAGALGYRRVHVLLRREGWPINQKKTRRVYLELGLQLRNKTPKPRVKAKLRDDRREATRPNEIWAVDFVHDQLVIGCEIRVLTVVDTFSRYVPVIDPRFSYRVDDVVQGLDRGCARNSYPTTIRVDQGTEFVSRDLDLWAYTRGRAEGVRHLCKSRF